MSSLRFLEDQPHEKEKGKRDSAISNHKPTRLIFFPPFPVLLFLDFYVLDERASEPGAVGLDVQLLDDAVVDEHGEALAADAAEDLAEVEVEPERLGKLAGGVGEHADLAGGALVTAPGLHDERVVDGDADDLVDALGDELVALADEAREVRLEKRSIEQENWRDYLE